MIMSAHIGFGLHDTRPIFLSTNAVNEDLADQIAGEFYGILIIERTAEFFHNAHPVARCRNPSIQTFFLKAQPFPTLRFSTE